MPANYYVWIGNTFADKYARVTELPEFIVNWKRMNLLDEGVPLTDVIPPDRVFELNRASRGALGEFVPNTSRVLLVSEALKAFLEQRSGVRIEFIPATLRNQRGRMLKEPYFIANVLGKVDCMDRRKSQVTWSSIDPKIASSISSLVLDPKRIPEDARLFRLGGANGVFLVREDLADELLSGPSEGAFFQELDDFGSELR
jgi:hypothetical protein